MRRAKSCGIFARWGRWSRNDSRRSAAVQACEQQSRPRQARSSVTDVARFVEARTAQRSQSRSGGVVNGRHDDGSSSHEAGGHRRTAPALPLFTASTSPRSLRFRWSGHVDVVRAVPVRGHRAIFPRGVERAPHQCRGSCPEPSMRSENNAERCEPPPSRGRRDRRFSLAGSCPGTG